MADGSHRFPPPLSLARRQPFDGLRAPAAMSAETPTVEAGLDDVARRDPDAIEAVFRELNAVDEAAAARRYQRLSRKRSVNHADGMIAAASLCGEVAAASRWLTAAQLPDPGHVRNANPRGSSIARPA